MTGLLSLVSPGAPGTLLIVPLCTYAYGTKRFFYRPLIKSV